MKIAIVSGSVYGAAEDVARRAAQVLTQAGFDAWHKPVVTLDELLSFSPEALLVVTSTTGMGELPGNIQDLYYALRERFPAWSALPGALIALGDSSYDVFCGGGEQMRELLLELGVREVLPMLRLDASETVTPEDDAMPWLGEFAEKLQA